MWKKLYVLFLVFCFSIATKKPKDRYFANCIVSEVPVPGQGDVCLPIPFNAEETGPSIEVQEWTPSGGAKNCKKGKCCLMSDPFDPIRLCVSFHSGCKHLTANENSCTPAAPPAAPAPVVATTQAAPIVTTAVPAAPVVTSAPTAPIVTTAVPAAPVVTTAPAAPVITTTQPAPSDTTAVDTTSLIVNITLPEVTTAVTRAAVLLSSAIATNKTLGQPSASPDSPNWSLSDESSPVSDFALQGPGNFDGRLSQALAWVHYIDRFDAKAYRASDRVVQIYESIEDLTKRYAISTSGNTSTHQSLGSFDILTYSRPCTERNVRTQEQNDFDIEFNLTTDNECVTNYVVALSRMFVDEQVSQFLAEEPYRRERFTADVKYEKVLQNSPHFIASAYEVESGRLLNGEVQMRFYENYLELLGEDELESFYANELGEKVTVYDIELRCVYLDAKEQRFSSFGVKRVASETTLGSVTCRSNHTSIFAVMLSIKAQVIPKGVKTVSLVTESFSIVALFFTVLLLICYRHTIRSDRTTIQINLSASLLVFHVLSVLHDEAVKYDGLCVTVTVATHYLLVTSSMWMLTEGVRLVTSVSDQVLKYKTRSASKVRLINNTVGWGVAAVIVGIAATVGLNTDTYMKPSYLYTKVAETVEHGDGGHNEQLEYILHHVRKYDRCWLDPGSVLFYVSVVVPVGVVLATNAVIAVRVTFALIRLRQRSQKLQSHLNHKATTADNALAAAKNLIILVPVLGIPWTIGFLSSFGDSQFSVIIMYANVLVNGLQGVVMFFLYCVMNTAIRKKIKPDNDTTKISTEKTNIHPEHRQPTTKVEA